MSGRHITTGCSGRRSAAAEPERHADFRPLKRRVSLRMNRSPSAAVRAAHLWFSVAVAAGAIGGCTAVRSLSDVQPVSLTTGIVRGTVVSDSTGEAIVGATLLLGVRAGAPRDSMMRAFSFPPDGVFRFTGVLPGAYVLQASADGYSTATVEVRLVTRNEIVTVRIELRAR